METIFQTGTFSCDAALFGGGESWVIRLFRREEEQYRTPLSDLVIPSSGLGYLYLKFTGGGAVLSGFLDGAVFSREMAEDIPDWLESILPECANVYLPYHIDLVSLSEYVEYNGEY